jgi:hypothetical protein
VRDDGGSGGIPNPYDEQTAINTNQAWPGDGPAVDVDLDGMTEYAEQLEAASQDVMSRAGNLMSLTSMPSQAWGGIVLAEAAHFRNQFSANANELFAYLRELSTALLNVGMAAQTVADAYGNSDGWSAASLDAVMFAYGMPGATRPAGLHPMVGNETYWGQQEKQQREGTAPIDPNSTEWGPETVSTAPGLQILTSVHPNGQRREIKMEQTGDGVLTTTTVYARDGSIVTQTGELVSSQYAGSSVQTTTTTYSGGTVTGRTEARRTYESDGDVHSETVRTYDADGRLEDTVTTTTGDDGSRTTTTTDAAGTVTEKTAVGADTEGSTGVTESPGLEELDRIQESYG